MEIERINENTVKFYISYIDIEDRGFEREEIWYNRERSEQLFWQMMDEVNYKEDFNVDGPLWIQVQAMEKGLEIIVTKAQVSKDGEDLELPENGKTIDVSVDEKIENMLDDKFGSSKETSADKETKEKDLAHMFQLENFEDVIQLSHYCNRDTKSITDRLFYYKDKYYLYIEFAPDVDEEQLQDDIVSQVYEFANDTKVTIHLLEAYGKVIFTDHTFYEVSNYFPA